MVAAYVEGIRNTPFLVQLYIIYFSLPAFGIRFEANQAALVMELFDGESLEARTRGDVIETIGIFAQVARGLAALHAMGYAHCDLKPNNILVNVDDDVKIIDFGQACRLGSVNHGSTSQ